MPEENTGAVADGGEQTQSDNAAAQNADNQQSQQQQDQTNGGGSTFDPAKLFAELPEDNREWLTKKGFTTPESVAGLAKQAFEQEKFIGSSIRIPGKDATPEEREAFLNKLGRPEKAEAYEFEVPKDLPEDLPYDDQRAASFKEKAHAVGLTAAQADELHNWFVNEQVQQHGNLTTQQNEQNLNTAKAETEKLVKLWGPLDGETAQANLEFADKALEDLGGAEVKQVFQQKGLLGSGDNDKVIYSAPLAQFMAKVGMSLYKEGDVPLPGPNGGEAGNPFDVDSEAYNLTTQMLAVKQDPERAKAMIRAAGKKPSDFGLRD